MTTGPPAPTTSGGPVVSGGRATLGTARRVLGWVALVVLVALLLILVAVVAVSVPPSDRPALDPGSVEPDGSRALVEVLRERGVDVVPTRRFADVRSRAEDAPAGSTVLIVGPNLLNENIRDELDRLGSDLVLVAPGSRVLDDLGRPLASRSLPPSGPQSPRCADPAARAAGDLDWDGWVYRPSADGPFRSGPVAWCFAPPDGVGPNGRFVSWTENDRRVVLLGSPEPLRNDTVVQDGNAALALGMLGAHDTLVWWRVDPRDPALDYADVDDDDEPESPPGLAPPWVGPMLVWLFIMGLFAMFWRARRMGRLVAEPLPVLVRSAETAQGRAALYREAGARDRAAAILRADAVRRLASRLGLPSSTPAAEVVSQVAARAGPDAAAVRDVLAGPPPADADALTRLADALDHVLDEPSDPARRESTP